MHIDTPLVIIITSCFDSPGLLVKRIVGRVNGDLI